MVRALASHARGPRFKSSIAHHDNIVANVLFWEYGDRMVFMGRSGGTVDALRSGRSTLKGVWVQIPPSAPVNILSQTENPCHFNQHSWNWLQHTSQSVYEKCRQHSYY